jgi:uncharacterized phage infection (PIP) family protein YhgE
MNKLGKIAPIIVAVACLASLFFTYELFTMKKDHVTKIAELTDSLNTTSASLKKTEGTLKQTQTDLTKAKSDLEQTTASLVTTKTALDQKTSEADTLKTQVTEKDQQLQKATADQAATQEALSKIKSGLEKAGITDINNLDKLTDKITSMGDENKVLGDQLTAMHTENIQLKARVEELSTTPVGLRGTVSFVQPKWGFVVMDVGYAQRVQPNTEFLVYRDNKFVAKVQVVSVGVHNCIAQITPDYLAHPPVVGDLVVH